MEFVLSRTSVDGVPHCIAGDPVETGLLKELGHCRNILVGHWTAHKGCCQRITYCVHQHDHALHIVISECIADSGIATQSDQGIGSQWAVACRFR